MRKVVHIIMKIDEVSLLTNDVRKLAAFYRQLLEIESDNNDETHQFILTEGTTLTIYNDGTVKNNLNQNICLAFTVDDIDREYKKVLAFLKSAGIKESDISVNPPVISDRQADNYGNEIMTYRYKASCVITVTSTDVDKVRALMNRQSELMKQGIALVTEEYGGQEIRYEFTGLMDIKTEMVEEAMANAHKTAEQFAEDTDADIEGVISAQQGQFSIEDRDPYTPYIKRVRVVTTVDYGIR